MVTAEKLVSVRSDPNSAITANRAVTAARMPAVEVRKKSFAKLMSNE